ncbi:MAG: aminoglycoside phosphotransferase family protein [Candidatus Poribacteria bacterium]
MPDITVPPNLAETCSSSADRRAWLAALPDAVAEFASRWSLTVGRPYDGASCAWVAPCTLRDGDPAVIKLGMPHMEARDEADALRLWDGDGAVRLLAADAGRYAMLLERCEPGASLRVEPEPEQDVIIAGLLRRLWRVPTRAHPFRPLSEMTAAWGSEALDDADGWTDPDMTRAGISLLNELAGNAPHEALLATDLHAGNVLRATREPWLAIDPKPFFGDTAYDATQHLFNCGDRLRADPEGAIRRFADLLDLDHERVRLWLFARAAVHSCCDAHPPDSLVRLLAP